MSDQVATPQRTVGPYEIYREIGRGGMAVVYLARQTSLERDVALKELSRFHAQHPHSAERFLHESKLTGSLNHPNIVTVYEYLKHADVACIAMEYAPYGSLRQHVGRMSLAQFAGVMEGILAGLSHAESHGIVHRDLKPENILVTAEGRVKIGDFGIAKATQRAAPRVHETTRGTTVGTPSYIAPEQAMATEVGPWTDLYSLGIMAWEHVVGHVPFPDVVEPVAILMRHVTDRIPPAAEVNPDVDADLSAWIDRLLPVAPTERTPSAMRAWEELEVIVAAKLGALWRREARLPTRVARGESLPPITPAAFESQLVPTPQSLPEDSSPGPAYVTYGRTPEPIAPTDAPLNAPAEISISGEPEVPAELYFASPEAQSVSTPSVPAALSPPLELIDDASTPELRPIRGEPHFRGAPPPDLPTDASELQDLLGDKHLGLPDGASASVHIDEDTTSTITPPSTPPRQAHPVASRRWRRLSWMSLPIAAAVCAAAVVLLVRHSSPSPTPSTSPTQWQKFSARDGAFTALRPAGWEVVCNDERGPGSCGNVSLPSGVRETLFLNGAEGIAIDRRPNNDLTPQQLGAEEEVAVAADYGGYTKVRFERIRVGSKNTYELAFTTNGAAGNPPGGVAYTFTAGSEGYTVSGLAGSVAAARDLASRVTQSLLPAR